jgi:choline-sulfatase
VKQDYKLIVDLFKDEVYLELYHVVNDPQELENLAFEPDSAKLILELLADLRGHMIETGDLISLPEGIYEQFIDARSAYKN